MKTWARETAIALVGVLLYEIFTGNVQMVGIIIGPILLFTTAAFGLNRAHKSGWLQSGNTGPNQLNGIGDQRSSQYPTGSTEQPDPRDK